MPAASAPTGATKRKRQAAKEAPKKRARSESSEGGDDEGDEGDDAQARILLLESEILESKKNYNNITSLIEIARGRDGGEEVLVAAVSLCRVFIRLLAAGSLQRKKGMSEKDLVVVHWLRDRLAEFEAALVSMFAREELALTALTLAMRLLRTEGQGLDEKDEHAFPLAFFTQIVGSTVDAGVDEVVRSEFLDKFVGEFDDIRFYTFKAIKDILGRRDPKAAEEGLFQSRTFSLLAAIDGIPGSNDELDKFYIEPPKKRKAQALHSATQHKRQAQDAWLALLSREMSRDQRKKVLQSMAKTIAPWFVKPELLMDFLTDCYNSGGTISLLALSGVFYLIQERNLDYPAFYSKLYSLLDADILHSKHRSRFFRLLDTFLESSHLPAALVASFIKRLARLSLSAPPGAIVVVVPWIYNLLKRHPQCTFMLHREPRAQDERDRLASEGLEDPFLADEEDPMETRAIDSCLWEVVQLQSHYHPNVATLAKILAEQFTKQFYKLEDFLDHSYGSLLEAEMAKDVKKAPVVEFMIPKRIFLPQGKDSPGFEDSLLVKLVDFEKAP